MILKNYDMEEDRIQLRKAIEDLESSSLEKRLGALEVLGRLRTRESIHFLLRCLHDESWHLRDRAAKILGSHGKKIFFHLKGVIRDGLWYARACSAKAIGETGEVEGLDLLFPLLEDESRAVRHEAQVALSKIITKDPSQVFNGYLELKDPNFVRNFLERLRRSDPKSYELLIQSHLSQKKKE